MTKQKNKKGSVWIWILIILILVAVGFGIYFWVFGGSAIGGIPQPPALPN